MFWGLVMDPNKRYSQTVERSFHLSMAALDVICADEDVVQVTLNYDSANYLLCSLKKGAVLQVPLDLHFKVGDKIAFSCNGQCRVHLTGYLIPEYDVDLEEEEEEVEVPSRKRSKRKAQIASQGNKKIKRTKQKVESSDDQDLDETDDEDLAKYQSLLKDLQAYRSSEGEVSDSDDEDDNDDDDDDDDEVDDNDDDDDDDDDDDAEDDEEEEEKEKVQKKSSKPQGNKNKEVQQQQQQQSKKKDKKKLVNGKVAKQDQQKKNKGENQQQNTANEQKKRVLEGGVIIKELKNGTGAPVKPGKFISVYFVGRLQNGKKFDSTTQGDGFKFRLGKGEVIKGWDIGIAGMKVGGKRQITIPPYMAYGAKGFPPTIPGNSTLVFDVELKSIH